MGFPLIIIVTISILFICNIVLTSFSRARLPPGPYQPPIIGNIFTLGPKPHHTLARLARKYGPLMSLKLGNRTTIVVSSPEIAKTLLIKRHASLPNKPIPNVFEALNHGEHSVALIPAGDRWRKLRKICKEHMFSVPKLEASEGIRREKVQKLSDYIGECCKSGRAVDLREAAFITSLNLMAATLFSIEIAEFESDKAQELKDVVRGVAKCIGTPNVADYFPILKRIDPQGIVKKMEVYFGKMFEIFDGMIDERLRFGSEKGDLLDALIDINQRDGGELSRNDINHLLLDLFMAGIDTTVSTMEWGMAELLQSPVKMSKVRDEIRDTIKQNGHVKESDIARFPYLQAVVKETFRLHPTAPFLVPHVATSDVEINGYILPKNAQIMFNAWAIGRDPSIWKNADSFMPERFLEGNERIDFKGNDFELIPFGAGRRICPGMPLADRMVHLMIATLVGNFGWNLEGMKPEELDMDDELAFTLRKAKALRAIPTELDRC